MKKDYEVHLCLPQAPEIEAKITVKSALSRDEAIRIATGEFIKTRCQPEIIYAKAQGSE